MMSVSELISQGVKNNDVVLVEGFVAYLNDGGVYLIDLDYGDDYTKAPAILLANDGLSSALESNVSLYGGGVSRLFHRAKVTGCVKKMSECMSFYVDSITVEDNNKWLLIDIKNNYDVRHGGNSIDWNDIFNNK